jgi:membrane protein YdbS with pleckstrin-like domain
VSRREIIMREAPKNKLDPRIKKVWRINSLIITFIIAFFLFGIFLPIYILGHINILWGLIPTVIVLIRIVLNFCIYPKIKYARWRYEVSEDDIYIRKGLYFVSSIIIPIVRVQFTDVSHGPILRAFRLSDVEITTAGGGQTIPGLTIEDADALRDSVSEAAKLLQESV